MGGKSKTRRIRWKPVEIENVFDISSSTTSEDTADLHEEEFSDDNYYSKSRAWRFSHNGQHNNVDYRNHYHQHYYRQQPHKNVDDNNNSNSNNNSSNSNNDYPKYGTYYDNRKFDHYANHRNQSRTKFFESIETHAPFGTNSISQIPATGVYINGLWIPASEVERIIANGDLPPPPYGPAIPPPLGHKNVYLYYGYIKKERNEKQSENVAEDTTSCQDDEGTTNVARGNGQTDEDYIPVIYASSCAPSFRRPVKNSRIRRRRFLDNDYVDLESDNCDIITKVTPKNYHFILSLDKASESEPSEPATRPPLSEDFGRDRSSTKSLIDPPLSPSRASNEEHLEFGTISEIGKQSPDVAETNGTTAHAMIEEFAQRAVNSIIQDALTQVQIYEETNKEQLNQPGCSGITPIELYAEKVTRTIMDGVMVESNKRRPPPIIIEDSINANPSAKPTNDEEKLIRQHASQMATEIIDSIVHPPDAELVATKAHNQDMAKGSSDSRPTGVREFLKQSGDFLGEGATSPDSGEASPRAPQQTTAATMIRAPPSAAAAESVASESASVASESVASASVASESASESVASVASASESASVAPSAAASQQPLQSLEPCALKPLVPRCPPDQGQQQVQSEFSRVSDHYRLGFRRDSDWAILNVPKIIENIDAIDCGQRKYVRIEDASKAMWSSDIDDVTVAADSDKGSPLKTSTKVIIRRNSAIDNDDHVIFAVATPEAIQPTSRETSVLSECSLASKSVFFEFASDVSFVPLHVRNFRPFGYCCSLM